MTQSRISPTPVLVETCRPEAVLPHYAHEGDAGMDLRAAADMELTPGQTALVPTGIKVAIPVGFEIQVRPRSGLSLNTPLRVPNSPGTIDSGFRDEIHVILSNESRTDGTAFDPETILTLDMKGNRQGTYKIRKGDRIAQMVLSKVESISWETVDSVRDCGEDRGGGFGHSGVK